jgi:hypothetical protein
MDLKWAFWNKNFLSLVVVFFPTINSQLFQKTYLKILACKLLLLLIKFIINVGKLRFGFQIKIKQFGV